MPDQPNGQQGEHLEFLGQQITVAVIVSLIVQAVVSLVVFAAGIRVGKERSDRTALRTLYKELFEHFTELLYRVRTAEPKRWSSYKLERGGYMPLMRELERTGDVNLLPKSLAKTLLQAEFDALQAGEKFHSVLEQSLAPALQDFISNRVDRTTLAKPAMGKPYMGFDPPSVLQSDDEYIDRVCARLETETQVLGLGFRTGPNSIETLIVSPEKLKSESLSDFYRALVAETKKVGGKAFAELKQQEGELEQALEIVSARIRDPHPFAETLLGTISEMFSQSAGRKN